MNELKQAFKKFLISLMGRTIIFAIITTVEKWAIISFMVNGLKFDWPAVALIVSKDLVVLALLGLVKFEKIALKASIGS